MKKVSAFEKECERKIKDLVSKSSELGLYIRREKLTRGPSFRVKSGKCMVTGNKTIFVDKRLPVEQQLNILNEELDRQNSVNYIAD